MTTGRYSIEIGQQVGQVLAAVNELPVRVVAAMPEQPLGPPGRSWQVLSRDAGVPIDDLSAARREFLGQMGEIDTVRELVDMINSTWRVTTVIHGDIRWDNWLYLPSPSSAPELRLVDWETASPGDPLWDVGSALASYLWVWVRSIPRAPGLDERMARFAMHPLASMRPGIAALCSSYVTAHGTPGTAYGLVAEALPHVAARLLVWASDEVDAAGGVSFIAAELVQLACNLVAEPTDGVELLVGPRS